VKVKKEKILIINGCPDKERFCYELAKQYKKGADFLGQGSSLAYLNCAYPTRLNPILLFMLQAA